MTLVGKRLPTDPRAALQQIINAYPRASQETWLRVFEAALEDDRALAQAFRREAAVRLISEHVSGAPRA
jgi:hypothetical protein